MEATNHRTFTLPAGVTPGNLMEAAPDLLRIAETWMQMWQEGFVSFVPADLMAGMKRAIATAYGELP